MQINSKTLNIAILGKGSFTPSFLKKFLNNRMFGLLCGFDSHSYDDLITLRGINEIDEAADAILIFDEKYCQYNYIKMCLRLCKHVFVGIPNCLSTAEINSLDLLAYEAGVKLQLSMPHRFFSVSNQAKNEIEQPHIIECNHYLKRNNDQHQLDLVKDMLLPDIDMILLLTGERIRSVSATGVGVLYNQPDVVNARIEFYNGCIAQISVSKISDKSVHKIRLFQNNYYYTLDYNLASFRKILGTTDQYIIPVDTKVSPIEDDTQFHKKVNPEEILVKEIESFYYCIVLGSEPAATCMDYTHARGVTDRILDQLERNFRNK